MNLIDPAILLGVGVVLAVGSMHLNGKLSRRKVVLQWLTYGLLWVGISFQIVAIGWLLREVVFVAKG